jgi:hypothetical protein
MAKALAKSTILKQKTVTYTKTKFIVTKKFMKFAGTDPTIQGVGTCMGIVAGAAGIFSFGHQLFISSTVPVPLTEEQLEALLNKQTENLKATIKNEVNQKLETWDIDHRERITELENQNESLRNQNKSLRIQSNKVMVVLGAIVLFATFGNAKGLEILAEQIAH